MFHKFVPNFKKVGTVQGIWPTDILKNEVMLFNADYQFALNNGGPITKEILSNIVLMDGDNVIISTRVTMTMKGFYPSIAGWHCDEVPRISTDGQPDLNAISPNIQHIFCIVADKERVSNTEFLAEELTVSIDTNAVWQSLDDHLNKLDAFHRYLVKEGDLIQFDQNTVHRATQTINPGWRLFFRLSHTNKKPTNEIRRQVQIYAPTSGWGW